MDSVTRKLLVGVISTLTAMLNRVEAPAKPAPKPKPAPPPPQEPTELEKVQAHFAFLRSGYGGTLAEGRLNSDTGQFEWRRGPAKW